MSEPVRTVHKGAKADAPMLLEVVKGLPIDASGRLLKNLPRGMSSSEAKAFASDSTSLDPGSVSG